jgi:hypothetical protein
MSEASAAVAMLYHHNFKWDKGVKPTVSFANLEAVKQHEPQTYALLKQPLQDGAKVSDDRYDYKLRHHARFGWSITRFLRTNTVSYGSISQIPLREQPKQREEQTVKHSSPNHKMQQLQDQLSLLQEIRMKVDALVLDTQQQLEEESTTA